MPTSEHLHVSCVCYTKAEASGEERRRTRVKLCIDRALASTNLASFALSLACRIAVLRLGRSNLGMSEQKLELILLAAPAPHAKNSSAALTAADPLYSS